MKQLLVTLFLVLGFSSLAQTYINRIDSIIGGRPAPSVLVEDSLIIVSSTSFLNFSEGQFSKYDFKGNLVQLKTYEDTCVFITERCRDCLKKKGINYYMAATNFYLGNNNTEVVFQKLDQNLDTIYSKKYHGIKSGRPFINALQFDTDSSFIATGYLYRDSVKSKRNLWVARFDTAFNVLWEKSLKDQHQALNGGYYAEDICIDAYGSVLVSGRGQIVDNGAQIFDYYSVTARLNRETGDLYWLKEFTGPEGSGNMFVLDEGDGTYLFARPQYLQVFPGTSTPIRSEIRFGLLDTLGNVLWDTTTGPKEGLFEYHDLQRTLDGNLYMAGARRMPKAYRSVGYKFTPQGDSIWFRDYYYQDTTDISYIWSFEETADSGFVHAGIFVDRNKTLDSLRIQYSWLFKTDKYGCPVQNCHTIGVPAFKAKAPLIAVYPNPSTGVFTIKIPKEVFATNLEVQVYNTTGQRVYAKPLPQLQSAIVLHGQPPGLYLLTIRQGSEVMHSQKIRVE